MRWMHQITGILVFAGTVGACADLAPRSPIAGGPAMSTELEPSRHIVVFSAERVPEDFAGLAAGLGASVERSHDAIGVATVIGLTDSTAALLAAASGVQAVEPSELQTVSLDGGGLEEDVSAFGGDLIAAALPAPTAAQFYARQWNMLAIHAPEAWAAAHRGSSDVVVGILDTGLDYTHPEFAGMIDLSRSVSFVPEDDPIIAARFPGRLSISDLHFHGTAVASIIASKGKVLASLNQQITFVAIKTVNRSLQGSTDRTISGILYAADQGVDVINLSIALSYNKSERPGAIAALQRATNYAHRKGALLVSAAGNDAGDLDHLRDRVRPPCELVHVICASATAPASAGGINGPWQNIDAMATYSAFGRSAISVAAPGGDGVNNSGRRVWVLCTSTATETSPAVACINRQAIAQPTGTSFSAPHVAGLAALLMAQLGRGNPALIRNRILQTADDLGETGTDPFYGRGRINVARALGVIP